MNGFSRERFSFLAGKIVNLPKPASFLSRVPSSHRQVSTLADTPATNFARGTLFCLAPRIDARSGNGRDCRSNLPPRHHVAVCEVMHPATNRLPSALLIFERTLFRSCTALASPCEVCRSRERGQMPKVFDKTGDWHPVE